jgi:hypothetical protein
VKREPRQSSLRRDLSVFRDAGFLVTLALLTGLSAAAVGVLIYTSEEYGIPVSRYLR